MLNDFPTKTAVVNVPLTFNIVRPISKIGSIAIIPAINGKYSPIPIPDKTTEIAIVAEPGKPAIPNEAKAMTITNIMINVISIGVPVILATVMATKAG